MLFFSSALMKHKLTFTRLTDCVDLASLAAKWIEDEWGYIRNKGVEFREGLLRSMSDDVFIGKFAGQPLAMFALLNHSFHDDLVAATDRLPHVRQLMYVYVEKDYRGLGFARQIIEEAKRLAREDGADLILLDTLRPELNRMYEKRGAKVVCEHQLFSYPIDVCTIKV